MNTIHDSLIRVAENRIRRNFDETKIEELANSIASKGLLHPVVLRKEDGQYYLVAGERRLRAMRWLHANEREFVCGGVPIELGHIPFMQLHELPPDLIREAELEENICRVDITWQEQARAVAELQRMRRQTNPEWTAKDTTREIAGEEADNATYQSIRRLGILGENLDKDIIARASSPAEAMKLLKRDADTKISKMFADYLGEQAIPEDNLHFKHASGISALQMVRDQIDCFVTDPPYGVGAEQFRNYNAIVKHEYSDSPEEFRGLMQRFAPVSYASAATQAHLYLFFDIRHWSFLQETFNAAGWVVWPWPIIWVKTGAGLAPDSTHAPSRQYETILFANKGRRPVTGLAPDVIQIKVDRAKLHAAQKPIALFEDLIRRSCSAGDVIADPFAGSATAVLAARNLGVTCYAYEIDEAIFKMGLARIATEETANG